VIDPKKVDLKFNVEPVMLDINTTIPLGLIVNELVSNSMKYAFPEGKIGEINIDFHEVGELEFELDVKDNGIGFPENIDFRNTESLGLQLVNSLTEQIDGKIQLDRTAGTSFIIKFKENKYNSTG
jgi:two-component sensor histidine kinase